MPTPDGVGMAPDTLLTAMTAAVALALAAVSGCKTQEKAEATWLFFPAPPEQPRVQFLTWATGAEQVEPPRTSFEEFILGEEPQAPKRINKPYGVAAHDGSVYVCDTKDICIVRLDFKNKAYSVFGFQGPGRLRKPINICIDPLGYKFVADPFRKQVVVYGPTDEYVTAFDVPQPGYPVDVALHGNELYVLDNDETCQIVVLDRTTGAVLRTFGGPGTAPGQFNRPNSLCISPDEHIYVSDTHNFRIQKLTLAGEVVWAKGTPGYRLGQFGRPRGVRVGPDGIVYVTDGATEIVQMFDEEGHILMRFGGPGNLPGAMVLPSTLAVDESSIPYFQSFVHKDFEVKYLLFVVSQYGPRLINVYAFGSFPEGYKLSESQIIVLPTVPLQEGQDDITPPEGQIPPVEPAEESEE